MQLHDLPLVNACLNGTAALFLISGFLLVRSGRLRAHKACMLAAFACSTVFLISYLSYHALAGSTRFQGTGAVRTLYFAILLSHTVLAATVPFLASITLIRGLRDQRARHRAIARFTLPIWLYVSVTGVVIYWMLYRLGYGAAAG